MTQPSPCTQMDKIRSVASDAFELNQAFAGLKPLYGVGRLLALNAASACKRLGAQGRALNVIMLEVGKMTDQLNELVGEVNSQFASLVAAIARWMRDVRALDLFLDGALQARSARDAGTAERKVASLDRTHQRRWARMAAESETPGERRLWDVAGDLRGRVMEDLMELQAWAGRLGGQLDRISLVATRQSKYLATMAKVEVGRISRGEQVLDTLVTGLEDFSARISKIEATARDSLERMAAGLSAVDCTTEGAKNVA